MKVFAAAMLAASAAGAVDKPVISLNFDEHGNMNLAKYSKSSHPVHKAPLPKEGKEYGICTAGVDTAESCKLPRA